MEGLFMKTKKYLSLVLSLALLSYYINCTNALALTVDSSEGFDYLSSDSFEEITKLDFDTDVLRYYEDENREINVYVGMNKAGNPVVFKSVKTSSSICILVEPENSCTDDILKVVKKYIDIDDEEKYGFIESEPMYYYTEIDAIPKSCIQIVIYEKDSENTISQEIAQKICDNIELPDDMIIAFDYIPAHDVNQILVYNHSDEGPVIGSYKTEDYETIKKCIEENNLKCRVFISDNIYTSYRTIVDFDDDVDFIEKLNVFSVICNATGLYTECGAEETTSQNIETIDLLEYKSDKAEIFGDINSDGAEKIDFSTMEETTFTSDAFKEFAFVYELIDVMNKQMRDECKGIDIRSYGDKLDLENPSQSKVDVIAGNEESANELEEFVINHGYSKDILLITVNPDFVAEPDIPDYTEQEDLITDSETIIKMLTEYADENIPRHGYIGIAYDQDSEYILIDTKSEDSVTAGIIKFINENKLDGSNIRIRVSSPTLNDSTDDTTGDVNFDKKVDLTDMSWLSLYLIGDKEFTDAMRKSADIDGDGEVKLADLAKFRQFLSKQISSLG